MAVFHRFCTVFPLFLLVLALASCSGAGRSPWDSRSAQQQQDNIAVGPYGTPAGALPADASAPSVKVAILLPLSGSNAAVGQSMLQAAQLAVFDLGYDNFELMPRDTSTGAAQAAGAAIRDGAQLILGPLFADDVRAVKSATSGSGVNVIAFSTDWTLAGGNTYMMGFLPFGQVERIAQYAAAKGLKRAAVAAGADTYGSATSSLFESEARKNGMTITRALSDASGYDAVFIPAGGAALSGILQRVANKNAKKLGTGLWDDARVAADPAMNGAWFAAPSPRARASFESRYAQTYGARPQRLASMAYDATALAAALARAGGFSAANLTNPNGFAGVDGIIRFSRSGLAERGMAVLEIRGGQIVEIDPAPSSFQR
jgi:ABC-type branched-subunit amino acid transport system substrate-binding protein